MPLPKRPAPPTRETIVAPAAVQESTSGQVGESTSKPATVPTFSARGVDPRVAERAKVYCARNKGLTMGQLVEAALTAYLDSKGA